MRPQHGPGGDTQAAFLRPDSDIKQVSWPPVSCRTSLRDTSRIGLTPLKLCVDGELHFASHFPCFFFFWEFHKWMLYSHIFHSTFSPSNSSQVPFSSFMTSFSLIIITKHTYKYNLRSSFGVDSMFFVLKAYFLGLCVYIWVYVWVYVYACGVCVCGMCMCVICICMCLVWCKYVCMFCTCLYVSMWVFVHVYKSCFFNNSVAIMV